MNLFAQLEAATRSAPQRTAAARPADLKAFHSATLKAAATGKQTAARERYIATMTGAGWLSESEIERRLGLRKHSANTVPNSSGSPCGRWQVRRPANRRACG